MLLLQFILLAVWWKHYSFDGSILVLNRGKGINGSNRNTYTVLYIDPPEPDDIFPCVTLKAAGNPPICIYTEKEDIYISASLAKVGVWESSNVANVIKWLRNDLNLGFIDIGANIGVYTLAVASVGRQVVAVEPSLSNIKRLQKSLYTGNLRDKVTLIKNAVSSKRGKVAMLTSLTNRGATTIDQKKCNSESNETTNCENPEADAILLDDLLEVIPFTKAIMKIDVEGYEIHAFSEGKNFFNKVHIPIIIMEWMAFKKKTEQQVNKSISYEVEVGNFITYLVNMGYRAYDTSMLYIQGNDWKDWTNDVYWIYEIK